MLEPRSLTAGRDFFFDDWVAALRLADRVVLAPIFHADRLGSQGLDLSALADRLGALGVAARACGGHEEVFEAALAEAAPGGVIATMSSGSFEGLARRLMAALEERDAE